MAGYRELLDAISWRTGLGSGEARAAAEATITALARALDDTDRQRLVSVVPAELRDDFPLEPPPGATRPVDDVSFVRVVALLGNRPLEQARVRAHAVLAALVEQEPELFESVQVPDDIRDLASAPPPGGGVVGPTGGPAPLSADQVRAALTDLPYWSGGEHELRRVVRLPRDSLDRVLDQVRRRTREELGRAPQVRRDDDDVATLVAHTRSVRAVTSDDIALAHRVDELIEEAGAGLA